MKIEAIRDMLAVISLAAIGIGLWWERPSASLVVVGAIILTGLLLPLRRKRNDT